MLSTDDVIRTEQVIRDLAAQVIVGVRNRKDHPTFGYTKASIRSIGWQMLGAIRVYAILTGQLQHVSAPPIGIRFTDEDTDILVKDATDALEEL